jgi:predicted dehydrogenase/threonine dehydrogenase-like Zn-dependent dehydrogenase
MKQVIQSLKTGQTAIESIPAPRVSQGSLLIATAHTLLSQGTERMLVGFGRSGLLDKARQQPEKVRQVMEKVGTDGLVPTLEAVLRKLDQPLTLGYSNVGVVLDTGAGVSGFARGQRVVSNGKHAELVAVPQNLCAAVPDGLSDEEASFTVVAAIGLQGIRLVQPTLGETVVVSGLGLIGLITVQLLRAQGCHVIGIDFDARKLALARSFGATTVDLSAGEDPVATAMARTRDRGVDAVLITASTRSDEPVSQAARMCRKRGRIVLVGVTGLQLSRDEFYEKELSFQVSCSYGPGRYDPAYEEKGHDYPIGFVRWTEQRNFEAVLDMMARGSLDVKPMITHRFAVDDAAAAYDLIMGDEYSLGILLDYRKGDRTEEELRTTVVDLLPASTSPPVPSAGTVSFLGAGNYASAILIPAFHKAGARLHTLVSNMGVSSVHYGRRFGFAKASTDNEEVFRDTDADTIVVSTRHDSHARYVVRALQAGRHVFVEKPLCLDMAGLEEVRVAMQAHPDRHVMVGFNRRFAPHVVRMKRLLAGVRTPKAFIVTVNAGAIPASHWTQDEQAGGGRIIGEACHFIDLLRYLADSPIASWQVAAMDSTTRDSVTITLRFTDGSIGTIHYLANGSKAFPKERVEVFAAGGILQLDNFRVLRCHGWKGGATMRLWRQDKGQQACVAAFLDAVRSGGPTPIPREEVLEVAQVTIEIAKAAKGQG